ncbi:MAG: hypothetical protein IH855_14095 [Bacteroidetes bacterium]|nr:hypothetical protein [Bacteroidota bacterium]
MIVLASVHFEDVAGRRVEVKESKANREVDVPLLEHYTSTFAAFANKEFKENGRGCVRLRVEDIIGPYEDAIATGSLAPASVAIDYLSGVDFPPHSPESLKNTAVADRLKHVLRGLIHSYDPATECLVLLTQGGGPYRLYLIKPESLPPKSLGDKPAYGLN